VVDKFVLQLEAQLADRNVTIELEDDARTWLVANGYDELMGARPMARLIQQTIKTHLADEVLFGRLKTGGAVRVVVATDENGKRMLGFEYPDGPIAPKPERVVVEATKKPRRKSHRRAKAKIPALLLAPRSPSKGARGSVPRSRSRRSDAASLSRISELRPEDRLGNPAESQSFSRILWTGTVFRGNETLLSGGIPDRMLRKHRAGAAILAAPRAW